MEHDLFNTEEQSERPVITQERDYDKKIAYHFTFGEVTLKFSFSLS
jgi:hypothetical protein